MRLDGLWMLHNLTCGQRPTWSFAKTLQHHTCDSWPFKVRTVLPKASTQTHNDAYSLPVSTCFPFSKTAQRFALLVDPSNVSNVWPVVKSHTCHVALPLPIHACLPLSKTAQHHTPPVWPSSLRKVWPEAKSHTYSVLSSLPLSTYLLLTSQHASSQLHAFSWYVEFFWMGHLLCLVSANKLLMLFSDQLLLRKQLWFQAMVAMFFWTWNWGWRGQ